MKITAHALAAALLLLTLAAPTHAQSPELDDEIPIIDVPATAPDEADDAPDAAAEGPGGPSVPPATVGAPDAAPTAAERPGRPSVPARGAPATAPTANEGTAGPSVPPATGLPDTTPTATADGTDGPPAPAPAPAPAPPRPRAKTPPPRAQSEPAIIDTGIVVVNEEKKKRRKISAGFTMGHLMTPAVSTLEKGETTVGTMVMGVGVTDRWTLAISPWLVGFYNMNNASIRYQADPQRAESWGFQASYFKNNPDFGKLYQMEAGSLWLNYRTRVSRFHRVHWSLNYMHFANYQVPFSLKRWSFNETEPQGQLSFTSLQEIATTPHTRVALEFGVIGLNYHYPNYHFGASTAYRFEGGYLQFGLSATGYFTNMTRSAYNQVYNEYVREDRKLDFTAVYKNSVAIHPEVQLQLFF